jgi:hypothetical protein
MVVAAPAQAVVPPGRALMIGDSLTFESAGPFFGQVLKHKVGRVGARDRWQRTL